MKIPVIFRLMNIDR